MTWPTRPGQAPPEAAGPAVEGPAGEVIYDQPGPQAVVSPPRDPAEREAERLAARDHGGCSRCADLPDGLVEAYRRALRDAEEKGRRLR
jgi:hypothetical protein